MKQIVLILTVLLFSGRTGNAQSFAPAAGFDGSTAIHKDSSVFVNWADGAEIFQSYQNIAFPENGNVNYGEDISILGKADGNPGVISLGDGGTAILSFNFPIVNAEGYDFAVFENGFFENENSELAFLELAFVEVSTDGEEFIRFPSSSELQTETQIGSFEPMNARNIHNFAGKYTMNYGTPFDLDDISELVVGTSVNINEINFIKIIDVVGSIDNDFASYDSEDNKVNDPYPTAFPSGGFDLDAVGVINNINNTFSDFELLIMPNPVMDFLSFRTDISDVEKVEIFSFTGILILSINGKVDIDVQSFKPGVYILKIQGENRIYSALFFK